MDYEYLAGIGVEIVVPNDWAEHKEEYLYEKTKDTELYYDRTGGNHITGDIRCYILIRKPLKDGFNIKNKINKFQDWLKANDIEYKDNVDIIGDYIIT